MDWITIISIILVPVTGVVSWFASARMRNNDTLQKMQDSINILVGKNKELVEDVLELRTEILRLKTENTGLKGIVEELNHKLENVKTITRTAK